MIICKTQVNPIELTGNWDIAYALDLHTLRCQPVLNQYGSFIRWNTTRSEIGEMLYQLKYINSYKQAEKIADIASEFIKENMNIDNYDVIIPMPPSNKDRKYQPVWLISEVIGSRLKIYVTFNVLKKHNNTELKNVIDPEQRKRLLGKAFSVNDDVSGKRILLIDDLYRSGETAMAATRKLMEHTESVDLLTITKTRTKR